MSYKFNATCLMRSLTIILLLFWLPLAAQKKKKEEAPDKYPDITAILAKNQKQLGGDIVVLVYKNDTIDYRKEMGEYFTAKISNPIASAGQWIAVATIMTFVDQGKIELDDPVTKYLPEFGKYAKAYLTIRHCLASVTGIENEKSKIATALGGKRRFASLEEEVKSFAAKEISNNPEKEFHYGNIGVNIAARVCEVVGKKSFDRLAQERIIRPLRMRGTSFTDENGGAINPSLGARSTAYDYLNFLVMMMNKGKFEDKQVLSEKAIAEMETPQFVGLPVLYKPREAADLSYGLGSWVDIFTRPVYKDLL
ncbi:MAG: class C beta-lactamase-related serine hydrolase, partial [Chitinophagaceae bacterium]